jgi:hypothetical protein
MNQANNTEMVKFHMLTEIYCLGILLMVIVIKHRLNIKMAIIIMEN